MDGVDDLTGELCGPFFVTFRLLDDGKLITTETGDHILRPDPAAEAIGCFLDDSIAGEMTMQIIDILETVQINKMEGEASVSGSGFHQSFREMFVKQRAVWQIGQGVMLRHVEDAGF